MGMLITSLVDIVIFLNIFVVSCGSSYIGTGSDGKVLETSQTSVSYDDPVSETVANWVPGTVVIGGHSFINTGWNYFPGPTVNHWFYAQNGNYYKGNRTCQFRQPNINPCSNSGTCAANAAWALSLTCLSNGTAYACCFDGKSCGVPQQWTIGGALQGNDAIITVKHVKYKTLGGCLTPSLRNETTLPTPIDRPRRSLVNDTYLFRPCPQSIDFVEAHEYSDGIIITQIPNGLKGNITFQCETPWTESYNGNNNTILMSIYQKGLTKTCANALVWTSECSFYTVSIPIPHSIKNICHFSSGNLTWASTVGPNILARYELLLRSHVCTSGTAGKVIIITIAVYFSIGFLITLGLVISGCMCRRLLALTRPKMIINALLASTLWIIYPILYLMYYGVRHRTGKCSRGLTTFLVFLLPGVSKAYNIAAPDMDSWNKFTRTFEWLIIATTLYIMMKVLRWCCVANQVHHVVIDADKSKATPPSVPQILLLLIFLPLVFGQDTLKAPLMVSYNNVSVTRDGTLSNDLDFEITLPSELGAKYLIGLTPAGGEPLEIVITPLEPYTEIEYQAVKYTGDPQMTWYSNYCCDGGSCWGSCCDTARSVFVGSKFFGWTDALVGNNKVNCLEITKNLIGNAGACFIKWVEICMAYKIGWYSVGFHATRTSTVNNIARVKVETRRPISVYGPGPEYPTCVSKNGSLFGNFIQNGDSWCLNTPIKAASGKYGCRTLSGMIVVDIPTCGDCDYRGTLSPDFVRPSECSGSCVYNGLIWQCYGPCSNQTIWRDSGVPMPMKGTCLSKGEFIHLNEGLYSIYTDMTVFHMGTKSQCNMCTATIDMIQIPESTCNLDRWLSSINIKCMIPCAVKKCPLDSLMTSQIVEFGRSHSMPLNMSIYANTPTQPGPNQIAWDKHFYESFASLTKDCEAADWLYTHNMPNMSSPDQPEWQGLDCGIHLSVNMGGYWTYTYTTAASSRPIREAYPKANYDGSVHCTPLANVQASSCTAKLRVGSYYASTIKLYGKVKKDEFRFREYSSQLESISFGVLYRDTTSTTGKAVGVVSYCSSTGGSWSILGQSVYLQGGCQNSTISLDLDVGEYFWEGHLIKVVGLAQIYDNTKHENPAESHSVGIPVGSLPSPQLAAWSLYTYLGYLGLALVFVGLVILFRMLRGRGSSIVLVSDHEKYY